ncbi:uncharacterized protein GIQ15_01933 [Arthroderma uncinatum]|uniref:uncharacterized protein n=1 Tax=Arthroderma uncinatum TaxID=74035 RepID=UPI00144A9EBE|nr:uncharacterized protein GIQ15_01933 [Arthroderma uncinatum]KAF3492416.1 hypothetical protein GIQ15_01933 [Arthroderma uncinatum]
MDEFAQTRGVDDLFDDDVTPVTLHQEPVHEPAQEPQGELYPSAQPQEALIDHNTSPAQAEHEQPPQSELPASHYRKRGANGRGRGRGAGFSRRLKPETPKKVEDPAETTAATHPVQPSAVDEPTQQPRGAEVAPQAKQPDSPEEAEIGDEAAEGDGDVAANGELAKEPVAQKVPAVRGDRSGTGGVRKPKLTEEELSERMAAAKITAAKKAAAHARAEADEASFQEREKVALAKRLEERQNRRVMLSEREKNRQRKLNSQTGREWDAEKSVDAFSERGRGGSSYRRGAHGGIVNDIRTAPAPTPAGDWENPSNLGVGDRSRGRGGRGGRGQGRRGGGPGGRGRQADGQSTGISTNLPPPEITAQDEFPALPGARQKTSDKGEKGLKDVTATEDRTSDLLSPIASSGTWADQVEVSEALEKSTAG